jgi:hypothetical protein
VLVTLRHLHSLMDRVLPPGTFTEFGQHQYGEMFAVVLPDGSRFFVQEHFPMKVQVLAGQSFGGACD